MTYAATSTGGQASTASFPGQIPLLTHDPARGGSLREWLDLRGNPSASRDWHTNQACEPVDFVSFARSEERFRGQFDAVAGDGQYHREHGGMS